MEKQPKKTHGKIYVALKFSTSPPGTTGVGNLSSTQNEGDGVKFFYVYFFLLGAIWENNGKVRVIVVFLASSQKRLCSDLL